MILCIDKFMLNTLQDWKSDGSTTAMIDMKPSTGMCDYMQSAHSPSIVPNLKSHAFASHDPRGL